MYLYKNEFTNYLRNSRGFSAATIHVYEVAVENLMNFCYLRDIDFASITARECYLFFAWLHEKKRSATTINCYRAALASFYDFLSDFYSGIVTHNPWRKTARMREQKKLPFTLDFEKAKTTIDDITNIEEKAILATLLYTGVRVSELVNMRFTDVDLINNKMLVYGKGSKERFIPISKPLLEILITYRDPCRAKTKFLFEGPNGKKTKTDIYNITKKYLRTHPHTLRHTFATTLLRRGVNIAIISKLLGHVKISSTMVYLDIAQNDIINALNNIQL